MLSLFLLAVAYIQKLVRDRAELEKDWDSYHLANTFMFIALVMSVTAFFMDVIL